MNTTPYQHQLDILIAATIAESKGRGQLRNEIAHTAESKGISLEQLCDTNEALACAAANVDRDHWLFDDEEAQALLLFAQMLDVCREAVYANGQIYLVGDEKRQSDELEALLGLSQLLDGLDRVLLEGAGIQASVAALKKFNRLRNDLAFDMKDRWAKGNISYKQKSRAQELLNDKEKARASMSDVRDELSAAIGGGTLRGRIIRVKTGRGFETRPVSLVKEFKASNGDHAAFIKESLVPAIEDLSWDAADNRHISEALLRLNEALAILRGTGAIATKRVTQLLATAASFLYVATMPTDKAIAIAIRYVEDMDIVNMGQALHQFNSVYVKQRPKECKGCTIRIKVDRLKVLLVRMPELLDFVITMRGKHPEVANAFSDLWRRHESLLRNIARPDLADLEAQVECLDV